MSGAPETAIDMLRLSTAGSVDDGKSTLIGRLLYERSAIYEDHLEAVEHASKTAGDMALNLALLTDGLRAEREQGITIDVAYRSFSTAKRRFVIADTPGHAQYTRNMATGTSNADLAIILLDASRGLTEQSYRHAAIASLLRVPHMVMCVNKMDLVDYSEAGFAAIRDQFAPFLTRLRAQDPVFIPISALHGDNVVARSDRMPWYEGPSLLEFLENVDITTDHAQRPARFPIQMVVKPGVGQPGRGYAGALAGGVFRAGDAVVALPSGMRTTVAEISTFDGTVDVAVPPMNVVLRLADEIDLSRGEMICAADAPAKVGQDVEALIVWFASEPLREGGRYLMKHTTKATRTIVRAVQHKIDVTSLERDRSANTLAMNELGRCELRTANPIATDPYHDNRTTGSFILIDEATNDTVGAGIVLTAEEWND